MKELNLLLVVAALAATACSKKDGGGGLAQDTAAGRDLSLAPVDTTAQLRDVPAETPPPAAVPPAPAPEPPPPPPPPATKPARPTPKPKSSQPPPAPSPTPEPAPPPAPPAPTTRSVDAGTSIALTSVAEFSTKTHKVGQTVTATVSSDVVDGSGAVVIPAGATVTLAIVELGVSENKDDPGKVALKATQVAFGGNSYDLDGTTTQVAHELKGRGVKAGDAAKVGAGAAAGAVIGRVLSGKKKGAVVGGVIGAAAGTAVAANSADRDVIVAAGAKIVLALKSGFSVKS